MFGGETFSTFASCHRRGPRPEHVVLILLTPRCFDRLFSAAARLTGVQ
jgi:hypothetical protein